MGFGMTGSNWLVRFAFTITAFGVVSFAQPAAAGDGAAAAEVLFAEGKRLVQEGNYAPACPKFEESQKLDPGMGTLYRLADCYEHVGRTTSAWAAFVEVAGSSKTSGQQARADDAKKRAVDLESTLPKLVIRVAQSELPGLVIKRGDVAVGRAQWNSPMPVDPGDVTVEASAPGRKNWRGSVATQARTLSQLEVPALELEPVVTSMVLSTEASAAKDRDAAGRASAFGTQRTLAVVAGIAGVAALGVGGAFGLVSIGKKSDADARCDATNACDDAGLSLRRDAMSAGNIGTIGFVAGGALAAAGAVLWLTAPSPGKRVGATSPRPLRAGIAPRWAGVSVEMELP